ncbi:hypothetical protein ACFSLT_26260 [Novosphingobium resinovorum]
MEINVSRSIFSAVVTAMLVGVSCSVRVDFSPVTIISAYRIVVSSADAICCACAETESAATAALERKTEKRIMHPHGLSAAHMAFPILRVNCTTVG